MLLAMVLWYYLAIHGSMDGLDWIWYYHATSKIGCGTNLKLMKLEIISSLKLILLAILLSCNLFTCKT
jgi:uncharacterized membrane protein